MTESLSPRPRVLAWGLSGEELSAIEPFCGTLRVANPEESYPEEHDVLIVTEAEFFDHQIRYPRRLAFAPDPGSTSELEQGRMFERTMYNDNRSYVRTQNNPAQHIIVTDLAHKSGLGGLTTRTCIPTHQAAYTGFYHPIEPARTAHILAEEVLEKPMVLAALLELDDADGKTSDSAMWLPSSARAEVAAWLRYTISLWRTDSPDRFPESAEWKSSESWASPDEILHRGKLREFEREEKSRRQTAEAKRQELMAEEAEAQIQGVEWRNLLTESGDNLVAAVRGALEVLGFIVIDSDALSQHKSAKREDLRVMDGAWTALVEVKGYSGAAKSNDLSQVTRAAVAYAATEGRAPDALWYVPNAERETDPAQRMSALAGREEDVLAFGSNNDGCLIDTRDLFALRRRVAQGVTEPADAREELKRARGRYTPDPAPLV